MKNMDLGKFKNQNMMKCSVNILESREFGTYVVEMKTKDFPKMKIWVILYVPGQTSLS